MTALDDEVAVFRLACLTDDIDRTERAAMRRVAKRLQRRWNAQTVTNAERLARLGAIDLMAELPEQRKGHR